MKSKVKEYLSLYKKFDFLYDKALESYDPLQEVNSEIESLTNKKTEFDYNNCSIVLSEMEQYHDDKIDEFEEQLSKDLDDFQSNISNPSLKVQSDYELLCKSIGRNKVNDFLSNTPIDFSIENWFNHEKDDTRFNKISKTNEILGLIFRFYFLSSFSTLTRVILSIVVWSILFGMFRIPFWIIILIFITNLAVKAEMKNSAHEYLKVNHTVLLGMISQQSVIEQYNEYKFNEFKTKFLDPWKDEINNIRNEGLTNVNCDDPNSLYSIVKNNLINKCNNIDYQISIQKDKATELQDSLNKSINDMEEFAPTINSREKILYDIVVDKEYNNGVLSPYVSLGFASYEALGVKELVYIKHDLKPIIITYSSQTYNNGEYFRKITARIIEQLMNGFLKENYHGFINMVLVDYESLHFPYSRTKGLMNVVRDKDGFNELITNITNMRDEINQLFDGKISTINPIRLKNKENTYKYNVAYFVGVDFNNIYREIFQLLIGGNYFGFVPFIFLNEDISDSLLNTKNLSKPFYGVLKEANDNKRIYSLETISENFKYDVVVSSNREIVDEKLIFNKFYSLDEFLDELENSEYSISEECIYIDVNELTEDIYNKLSEDQNRNYFRYFTLDGNSPTFIDENKVIRI